MTELYLLAAAALVVLVGASALLLVRRRRLRRAAGAEDAAGPDSGDLGPVAAEDGAHEVEGSEPGLDDNGETFDVTASAASEHPDDEVPEVLVHSPFLTPPRTRVQILRNLQVGWRRLDSPAPPEEVTVPPSEYAEVVPDAVEPRPEEASGVAGGPPPAPTRRWWQLRAKRSARRAAETPEASPDVAPDGMAGDATIASEWADAHLYEPPAEEVDETAATPGETAEPPGEGEREPHGGDLGTGLGGEALAAVGDDPEELWGERADEEPPPTRDLLQPAWDERGAVADADAAGAGLNTESVVEADEELLLDPAPGGYANPADSTEAPGSAGSEGGSGEDGERDDEGAADGMGAASSPPEQAGEKPRRKRRGRSRKGSRRQRQSTATQWESWHSPEAFGVSVAEGADDDESEFHALLDTPSGEDVEAEVYETERFLVLGLDTDLDTSTAGLPQTTSEERPKREVGGKLRGLWVKANKPIGADDENEADDSWYLSGGREGFAPGDIVDYRRYDLPETIPDRAPTPRR